MNRLLLSLVLTVGVLSPLPAGAQQDPGELQRIRSQIQSQGGARVIVELRLPAGAHVPEGRLSGAAAINVQRQDIANAGAQVLSRLGTTRSRVTHRFTSLPLIALEVDAPGLAQLQASGLHVTRIMEDKLRYPVLYQSGPLVQADQAWALGADGTGWTVAVIDTGVDKTHPFLAGKVVSEACYVIPDGCPGGLPTGIGPGTGIPANNGQYHGTHVAGIVAGNAPNAVPPPASPLTSTSSGMARGAQIIAINVFGPYNGAWDSDLIAGLNRVYDLRTTFNIASVNMSLGDGVANVANCDGDALKPAIDQLRSVNIATVIAAGNESHTNALSGPGCISTAVSVGSTTKFDTVSSFSNVSSFMSLFAPGSSIDSSILPSGAYAFLSGTSMATPHVAGAWAVLKQASPTATVSQILTALQSTGIPITDTRGPIPVTKSRINIKNAVVLLQPSPVPTSIAPNTALLGATLNVTITGTGFASGATSSFGAGITVNSTAFVSSIQLTANITVMSNATPGPRAVSVTNPNNGTGALANAFTITAPVPSISSISPTPVIVGGPAFTLAVTGTGFATTSVVQVNGANRTTGFGGATQLTATVLAADIATVGSKSVTVVTPAPGGGTSGAITLNVNNPAPTLASLSPSTLPAGGPAFTLTVTGGGFVSGSTVRWNGSNRATTFVSATQVTAAIPASDLVTAGTPQVTVLTPAPGGGTSSALPFTVSAVNPGLTLSSISPSSASQGGPAFTLTVTGSGFEFGSTVRWNGSNRATTFVNATQLTAAIPASDLAAAGTPQVTVFTSVPGGFNGTTSNALPFTVNAVNPVPVLSSLLPSSAQQGGPAFTLTVTGSGFVSGSTVRWNGVNRTTTFVSAIQLTASIPASDLAAAGTPQVTVFTPAPGGGTSGALPFTVTAVNPVPVLSSLLPNSALQSGPAFTLTVTGSGFVPASVVQWNGSSRATTFVSAIQLTASIPASDLAAAGTPQVTVFTPAPGGGTSGTVSFTITAVNPVPVLSSLLPNSALQGGPAFTLTVNGSNFVPTSVVQWNGSSRATTFANANQLTASIPASDLVATGPAQVTVFTPAPGGGTSAAVSFTVTAVNPVPVLSSLLPSSGLQGGPAFTLTVTGSGFVSGSTVRWNGVNRTTTFVSALQLTASIPASDLVAAGPAQVTVFTPAPGGGTSGVVSFTVTSVNPVPVLSTLVPSSGQQGGPAFTLTVTGSGFVPASVVQWNGSSRATTFVSALQLTASIPASDLVAAGSAQVTVFTPAPGGGTSGVVSFTVTAVNPVPVLSTLVPSNVTQDGPAFTLTVTGSGFVPASVVRWNGSSRATTFVSANQLTATILAADIASTPGALPIARTAQVTVFTPGPGGGTSTALTFTVTVAAAVNSVPVLASLAPSSARVKSNGINVNVYPSKGSIENIFAVYQKPDVQLGIVQSGAGVLVFVARIQPDQALQRVAKKI